MKAALTSMLLCFCAQGHLPATLSPWQDCMTSRSGLCRQPAQGGRASTTPDTFLHGSGADVEAEEDDTDGEGAQKGEDEQDHSEQVCDTCDVCM